MAAAVCGALLAVAFADGAHAAEGAAFSVMWGFPMAARLNALALREVNAGEEA